jgi:ABC-type amino acid transport system permease subunit
MSLFIDPDVVTHGIQLAVAPVFLLTAVSGMIGSVAGRLARIIDRARLLEERLKDAVDTEFISQAHIELNRLRTRGHLANGSIGLLTVCSFLIGLTIIVLFLGETTAVQIDRLAIVSFLAGVVCFMLALGCFMAETLLATHTLKFSKPKS